MWSNPEFRKQYNAIMSELFSGEGNPFFGKTHTDDTKRRISEARKGKCTGADNPQYGKPISEDAKNKMRQKKNKAVIQIDVQTGKVIRTWESIKIAEETLHIRHISDVCRKLPKYKTAGGYRWEYLKEGEV